MSRDPMREYIEWERRERRTRRIYLGIAWALIMASMLIVATVLWLGLAFVFTLAADAPPSPEPAPVPVPTLTGYGVCTAERQYRFTFTTTDWPQGGWPDMVQVANDPDMDGYASVVAVSPGRFVWISIDGPRLYGRLFDGSPIVRIDAERCAPITLPTAPPTDVGP
jgi:hypothetical protein